MNIIIYFWDIQNCHIPANQSVQNVVGKIREYGNNEITLPTEWGFYVFEDISKMTKERRIQFYDQNIQFVDVPNQKPNAADIAMTNYISDTMQKYNNLKDVKFTYVIITGDSDFHPLITRLKINGKISVRLICNSQTRAEMKKEAFHSICLHDLVGDGSECLACGINFASDNQLKEHMSTCLSYTTDKIIRADEEKSLIERCQEQHISGEFIRKTHSQPNFKITKITGHQDLMDKL